MAARVGSLGLTAAGLLLAGEMAVSLARGPSNYWRFATATVLAGASLPLVARRQAHGSPRLATVGVAMVLAGLTLVTLFNLQVLLMVADLAGFWVLHSTMEAGRKAVFLVLGGGLVVLAAGWDRTPDDLPVRLALLGVGLAGVWLAFAREGRSHFAWYLALGGLWLYLGLARILDARRAATAPPRADLTG